MSLQNIINIELRWENLDLRFKIPSFYFILYTKKMPVTQAAATPSAFQTFLNSAFVTYSLKIIGAIIAIVVLVMIVMIIIVVLLLYFLLRRKRAPQTMSQAPGPPMINRATPEGNCPVCGQPVRPDFYVCPNCGNRLK